MGLSYAEVANIARTMAIPPTSFVSLVAPRDEYREPAGLLRLGPREAPYALELQRRDGVCVFLLTLGSGRKLCGLGALAPRACRDYPTRSALTRLVCWRGWREDEIVTDTNDEAQRRAEARWDERIAGRAQPLDEETALAALLSLEVLG